MSDVIDRPLRDEEKPATSRLRIVDCDVHPSLRSADDLNEFLPKRWQQHLKEYGSHLRTPYLFTTPYPRSSPLIARRDTWPPTGGPPGSDLDFMRKQHLDPLDVEFGILQVLDLFIFSQQNLEVPHLKRKPSEYVREHFWFTTQPIDEPDEARHLRSLIEWVGIDRLLFSSDYPHWDFDDPRFAFKTPLTEAERKKIFSTNARAVYKF